MSKKRERKKHFDWHHRKPSSLGHPASCLSDSNENMSHVTVTKHRAWHTLFSNSSVEEIVEILNRVWVDPDYIFTVKRKES